jgi:hypothetical protein
MAAPRFALTLLMLLAPAGASQADAVEPTPMATGMAGRAASYYATGLQAPLLEIRAGTKIVATCQRRFRTRCSKPHREAADRAGLTLEYLDALSLFPERLSEDPTARLKNYADVVTALDAANVSILRAARDYDGTLFARYRAALNACPPENPAQHRESLQALVQRDLQMFDVETDERARFLQSISDQEAALAADFSDAISAEECVARRQLGELLLTMLSAKLEPWGGEAKDFPGPDATRGIANEFLFQATTELELIVNPDARPRFDAFAQRIKPGESAPQKSGFSLRW